jgi:hypothetical protein
MVELSSVRNAEIGRRFSGLSYCTKCGASAEDIKSRLPRLVAIAAKIGIWTVIASPGRLMRWAPHQVDWIRSRRNHCLGILGNLQSRNPFFGETSMGLGAIGLVGLVK